MLVVETIARIRREYFVKNKPTKLSVRRGDKAMARESQTELAPGVSLVKRFS